MTRATSLTALLLAAPALFIATSWAASPRLAAQQDAPAGLPQRFQMTLSPRLPSGGYSTVFIVDTATGECWYRSTDPEDKWTGLGSPAQLKDAGKKLP